MTLEMVENLPPEINKVAGDVITGIAINGAAAMAATDLPFGMFGLIAFLAFFGSSMRLLYRWQPDMPWENRIGFVGSSVFGAILVGLMAYIQLHDYPTILLALTGSVGWVGFDAIEAFARKFVGLKE